MNTVSFVMPAYNAATTIAQSVDSIFAGNFSPGDEVVIVNDCSTDDTLAIIEHLATAYAPHITIVSNAINKGCPASRNAGVGLSRNPLIFNLDADNILVPGSVQKLVAARLRAGTDIAAFATYKYFITNPRLITHYWYCRTGPFTLADFLSGYINPGPGGNYLYTKASYHRLGGYWEYGKGLHEAWGFTLKQLAAGHTAIVVPHTHYLHRHGHASLFVTESKSKTAEYELVKKMITPYRNLLTAADWEYIENTPQWLEHLDRRPLKLKDGTNGHNGTVRNTWYGLWQRLRLKLQS